MFTEEELAQITFVSLILFYLFSINFCFCFSLVFDIMYHFSEKKFTRLLISDFCAKRKSLVQIQITKKNEKKKLYLSANKGRGPGYFRLWAESSS